MNSPIIFDIETIPDRLTEYNQAFPKSKKKAGIHAIISRVVAIGYDLGGYRKVSYPSPEEEGLSAALSRSVSESEICPDLQASLHAPTNRRGPSLAGTLASDLPETASNRVSAVPFRARVWQSRTGSASSGLPGGCLRCPSTYRRWI